MLFACGQDRAIRYLNENLAQIGSWGEILQCAAIDVIRKHTREGISDMQKVIYFLFFCFCFFFETNQFFCSLDMYVLFWNY